MSFYGRGMVSWEESGRLLVREAKWLSTRLAKELEKLSEKPRGTRGTKGKK